MRKAKPFVKWAGGKRRLLNTITAILPKEIHRYFELFVGGGALFWQLAQQQRATAYCLNDSNQMLINAYTAIRDQPLLMSATLEIVVDHYNNHVTDHKAQYYLWRKRLNGLIALGPTNDPDAAMLFLTINRLCFNGLWRVNSDGRFNVPFNKRTKLSFPFDVHNASRLLKGVEITCGDWQAQLPKAQAGDLVYIDPAYAPVEKGAFVAYTKSGFDMERRLAMIEQLGEAARRGVNVLASDSANEDVCAAYQAAGFHALAVQMPRSINSDASKRGRVKEYLFHSWEIEHDSIVCAD